jgi:predicted transcriptional regulator
MSKQNLSQDLKRFIREKIQTVLRLEVLILLHRHQSRAFSVAEVADELGFEKETTANELAALEASGLVAQSKADKLTYRYHPLNAAIGSMIEHLASGYSRRRVPILSVMFTDHPDRTRLFAEAFRIIRSD